MTQPSTPPSSSLLDEDEFDAGTVVPEIKWNFTKYCGPDAKGVTPEPTDKQMKRMMTDLQKLMLEYGMTDTDATDVGSLIQGVGRALTEGAEAAEDADDPDAIETYDILMQRMCDIIARFASDKPSSEMLLQLPLRIRVKFFGWFMGHFSNPEQSAGASTGSQGLRVVG